MYVDDNSRSCRRMCFLMKKIFWGVECHTDKKLFVDYMDHDLDSGIFVKEFLPLQDMGNCKNFESNSTNNDYNAQGYELLWRMPSVSRCMDALQS